MKQANGDSLCPWRAALPLLAAAAVIPCLASGDPLGRETPRIVALQAAAFAACLLAGPVRPRLNRAGLWIWLIPMLLGALFLAGLRDGATLAAGLPFVFAGALAVPASALGTRRVTALAVVGTAAAAGAVIAVWGIADSLQGGKGVGPLGNANRVGEYVAAALPAAAACFLLARRHAVAAAGLTATVLLLGLTVACKSRGGLVTGVTEIVVLTTAAAGLRRVGLLSTEPWRRARVLGIVAIVVIGAAWAVPMTRPHVQQAVDRVAHGVSRNYPANLVRFGLARGSAVIAATHPLGVGTGGFREAYALRRDPVEHRVSGWKSTVNHAHNQYLHSAIEAGWIGALLIAALCWLTGVSILRTASHTAEPAGRLLRLVGGTACIGTGVASIFGTPLLNPAALTTLVLLASAAAGARSGPAAFRHGRAVTLALAAALLAATLITWPALRSYRARVAVFDAETAAELEATWVRVTLADPDDADTWQRLGHLRARAGRRGAALAAFERALVARPQFPNCLLAAADLLAAERRFAAAIDRVDEAARLQPWNPHPHYLGGKIRLVGGDSAGGVAALKRALAADRAAAPSPATPPSTVAIAARETLTTHLMERADATMHTEGRTAAAPLYREILIVDPGHPEANLRLGLLLRREGKTEQARRLRFRGHLERGRRLLRTLAALARDRGKPVPPVAYEKVLASLVRAHENDPDSPDPFYFMAVTRLLRGRDEAPWNDAEQIPTVLAEARHRGLLRLENTPDGGEHRSLVAPAWQ